MSDNGIGDEGAIAVAEALKVNRSLQTLDISRSFSDLYFNFYFIIILSLSFKIL